MTTCISSKGQLVLPAELRRQDGIEPGQEFEIERLDRGEYRLIRHTPPPNEQARKNSLSSGCRCQALTLRLTL